MCILKLVGIWYKSLINKHPLIFSRHQCFCYWLNKHRCLKTSVYSTYCIAGNFHGNKFLDFSASKQFCGNFLWSVAVCFASILSSCYTCTVANYIPYASISTPCIKALLSAIQNRNYLLTIHTYTIKFTCCLLTYSQNNIVYTILLKFLNAEYLARGSIRQFGDLACKDYLIKTASCWHSVYHTLPRVGILYLITNSF